MVHFRLNYFNEGTRTGDFFATFHIPVIPPHRKGNRDFIIHRIPFIGTESIMPNAPHDDLAFY